MPGKGNITVNVDAHHALHVALAPPNCSCFACQRARAIAAEPPPRGHGAAAVERWHGRDRYV
jgi:hypothetical protein